jgi:hypothetical protein
MLYQWHNGAATSFRARTALGTHGISIARRPIGAAGESVVQGS